MSPRPSSTAWASTPAPTSLTSKDAPWWSPRGVRSTPCWGRRRRVRWTVQARVPLRRLPGDYFKLSALLLVGGARRAGRREGVPGFCATGGVSILHSNLHRNPRQLSTTTQALAEKPLPCSALLAEPQREEVGLAQDHAQANRLVGQGTEVGFLLPRHRALQSVAEQLVAVGQPEAG